MSYRAMSYTTLVDGDLVAIEFTWGDGTSSLDLVDLGAESPALPWTEACDGCGGTRIVVGGVSLNGSGEPVSGPCASCWGSGRVLFAFEHPWTGCESCAPPVHYVPPVIAQPWIHKHRTAAVPA